MMKKERGIFSRLVKDGEVINLAKTRTTRCVYESEDLQRVEMELQSIAGDIIIYSLSPQQTAELIEKLTHCYYAINPALKVRREGQG